MVGILHYEIRLEWDMSLSDFEGELEWLHALFQGLENMGVELPMGDYTYVYSLLEEMRGEAEE